jgi:hypothetical protein
MHKIRRKLGKVSWVRLQSWLIVRILLIVVFSSEIQKNLFTPFLNYSNLDFIDPWGAWNSASGSVEAFPYGYVMYIFFLPAILIHRIVQFFSYDLNFEILIALTLLAIEFVMFKYLNVFEKGTRSFWSWVSIFSPITLYVSYIHGQIDLIPTALLVLSTVFILRNSWFKSGLFVGLAISAKFSFILAVPFFVIYFLSIKARRNVSISFIQGVSPGILLFVFPAVFSQGYQEMVMSTPEVLKSLDAQIQLGISTLYLVPVSYLLVLLSFWSLRYISRIILISYIGVAFFVVALTQTSSVGWFYWCLPLILMALRESSNRTLLLFLIWQSSVSGFFFLRDAPITTRLNELISISFSNNLYIDGLLFTFNVAIGALLVLKVISEAQKSGDIYSLAKKPLTIGIAGDSGVGKDTLTNEIARLFGDSEVALLLGDDYHLHERGETSWLATTHLALDSNDLELMGRDFRKLLNGEKVFVKHYDHSVGRFTLPEKISPSNLIVLNGLHAIMIPGSELTDLKIFISMEV